MGRPFGPALNPFFISYKPKINSTTVNDKRNRSGVRVPIGGHEGEGNEYGEGETVKATVHDYSRVDVYAHGFWKWGTSTLLDM